MAPQPQPKYHSFVDFMTEGQVEPTGLIVPQRVYAVNTTYKQLPAIRFNSSGQPGVNLKGLDLDDSATAVTSFPSDRITLRINWPGYSDWFYRCAIDKEPRTLGAVANKVANAVTKFVQEQRSSHCTEPGWNLARTGPDLANLILVELRHVSEGSWQPVLALLFADT